MSTTLLERNPETFVWWVAEQHIGRIGAPAYRIDDPRADLHPRFLEYIRVCIRNGELPPSFLEETTRYDQAEVRWYMVDLARAILDHVNDKFLTATEIRLFELGDEWTNNEWVIAWQADKQRAVTGESERLYQQAVDENRDIHAKVASIRKELASAEASAAEWRRKAEEPEGELARLRSRERELIMFYRAMPYQDYLRTPHWQNMRDAALNRAAGKCSVCAATSHLQVHHNTYDRRGEELPTDLTVLCRPCHAKYHDKPE